MIHTETKTSIASKYTQSHRNEKSRKNKANIKILTLGNLCYHCSFFYCLKLCKSKKLYGRKLQSKFPFTK